MLQRRTQGRGQARAKAKASSTYVGTALRLTLAGLLCAALLLILGANTARALNLYQDIFVTLSARPLAMGGTGAATGGPSTVFYNPAGLSTIRRLVLMANHSARHFPGMWQGKWHEWDQLDGDTQAVVVPLPLSTYAHGFTFGGEMGYDFRGHPPDGSLGYPRERYWGGETYDAVATSCGLPVALGASRRWHFASFTPPQDDAQAIDWVRLGEGWQWGLLARVWPGLDYGVSGTRMDYDYMLIPRDPPPGQPGAVEAYSRLDAHRTGWALHPTAWLTLAQDNVKEMYDFGDSPGLGSLHTGSQELTRRHSGGELCLGALAKYRWGDYDGHPTVGLALNVGGIWVNYAEIEDLLPEIVGAGDRFKDVHIYGFDITIL